MLLQVSDGITGHPSKSTSKGRICHSEDGRTCAGKSTIKEVAARVKPGRVLHNEEWRRLSKPTSHYGVTPTAYPSSDTILSSATTAHKPSQSRGPSPSRAQRRCEGDRRSHKLPPPPPSYGFNGATTQQSGHGAPPVGQRVVVARRGEPYSRTEK